MFKRFGVYTTPHAADPAWIAPVFVYDETGRREQTDAKELLQTAIDLHYALGVQQGKSEESRRAAKYLATLGWSEEQMRAFFFFAPEKVTKIHPYDVAEMLNEMKPSDRPAEFLESGLVRINGTLFQQTTTVPQKGNKIV